MMQLVMNLAGKRTGFPARPTRSQHTNDDCQNAQARGNINFYAHLHLDFHGVIPEKSRGHGTVNPAELITRFC